MSTIAVPGAALVAYTVRCIQAKDLAKDMADNSKQQIKEAYRTVRKRVRKRAVALGLRKDSLADGTMFASLFTRDVSA